MRLKNSDQKKRKKQKEQGPLAFRPGQKLFEKLASPLSKKPRKNAKKVIKTGWARFFSAPTYLFAFLLVPLAAYLYFDVDWQRIAYRANGVFDRTTAKIGFSLDKENGVEVTGRQRTSATQIQTILQDFSNPSGSISTIGLELDFLRENLERLPWIKKAVVQRRLPNRILLSLEEYVPVAFLQTENPIGEDSFILIERNGKRIEATLSSDEAKALEQEKLISVAGKNAETNLPPLLKALKEVPLIENFVIAAHFQEQRFWTLFLNNGLQVVLPEDRFNTALAILAKYQRQNRVLERNALRIDLKDLFERGRFSLYLNQDTIQTIIPDSLPSEKESDAQHNQPLSGDPI